MAFYVWQDRLASQVLDNNRTPVFWAGFWPGGEEGIDTREALAGFISSVNGFQLADTEWGQAAESDGANNLENCAWDRKKSWWNAASIKMAQAMALHKVPKIIISLHKELHGKYSFYNTVLYRAELRYMGIEMMKKSTWNPQFEVRSIAVKGAPPHESGCALASAVMSRLEKHAKRPVTVWCRTCTTLQSCGDKNLVEQKRMDATCIGNCQNGQGVKVWANDDIYEGQWRNNLRNGQGTMTWASGAKYQGEYKNDLKDGQGTYTCANGQKYQGQWKNGNMDGQGTYTWPSGAMYQGAWKNDLRDGQGTYTYASGDQYQGEYKNGKKDGQGTMTSASGTKYQREYKNGVQI